MKLSKYILPLATLLLTTTGNVQAQSCMTLDGSGGPAIDTFGTGTDATTCIFELSAPAGPEITCVRGYPNGSLQNPAITLAAIANRAPLSSTDYSVLDAATSIRGGFAVYTVGGQQKTTVFANRTAFRSYINPTNNYSPPNNLPILVTTPLNTAVNSVESVAVVGTTGALDGYHASGTAGSSPAGQFHVIMDAAKTDTTYFIRVGTNTRIWQVCKDAPQPTPSFAAFNAYILATVQQFQTAGASAQKTLLRN